MNRCLILAGCTICSGSSIIQNKKNASRSRDVMPALAGKWLPMSHHELPKMHRSIMLRSWEPKYVCTPYLCRNQWPYKESLCNEVHLPNDGDDGSYPDKEVMAVPR
jgi:hypothetical protein